MSICIQLYQTPFNVYNFLNEQKTRFKSSKDFEQFSNKKDKF